MQVANLRESGLVLTSTNNLLTKPFNLVTITTVPNLQILQAYTCNVFAATIDATTNDKKLAYRQPILIEFCVRRLLS